MHFSTNITDTLKLHRSILTSLETRLNSSQGSITLTTSGTSGASTLIGNSLNIPVYSSGGGSSSWGSITGTLSNQTDLNDLLLTKVTGNASITGATKTKITYDSKGLVTSGVDATTADIADSLNKRYVTDAQQTIIGNTSGTNTGDNATNSQYSGLAASKQDTLVSGTNIKTINSTTLLGSGNITTGSVTSIATSGLISGGTITGTGTITTSMATGKLVGRSTAGTGVMEEITVSTGLTLSGTTLSNSLPFNTPLTTKGDMYVRNGSADTRLPIGLDTQVLLADSTAATGLKWGTNTAATPTGYYGAFQDVTIQTLSAINTPYAMKLGVTDLSNQVTVVSDGSNLTRITIANTGIYNLQFSAQFDRTNSGTDTVDIWLRKNGVDVPGSGGKIILTGGVVASAIIATWNYLLDVTSGDYYQLMWSGTDTHIRLLYEAAQTTPFAHPIIPSLIVTVTQQSGIMAGTGITALNSLTGAAQTIVAGTSGTNFAVSSTGTTHTLNLPDASSLNRGALTSANWSTFNGKENVLTFSSPLSRVTNTISIPLATTSVSGYLSSTDWTTFYNKGAGTVTSVATGTGLTGGTITGSGTISFSTAAVGTWAATPSSVNLASAMTDETGSGSLVFGTSPTFTTSITVNGKTVSGYNTTPLQGSIQDGVTSILGDLKSWNTGYYQGTVLYSETAAEEIIFGQLCYRLDTGEWGLASSESPSNYSINMLGICVKTAGGGQATSILINGFVETTYAVEHGSGDPQYIDTTPGVMTYLQPSLSGNVIRIIGHTFWTTSLQNNAKYILHFNPDNTWIQIP